MNNEQNNEQNMCGNCWTHGIVENDVVKIPCMNCACDNGYQWNGRRCYGISGLEPGNERRESTLEILVTTFVIIVRPRYIDYIPPDINGRTIDEYILDKFIPDEGKDMYKEMIRY